MKKNSANKTDDYLIIKDGIRYIGCLEVKNSVNKMNVSMRINVAAECINRVCEAAGLKPVKKRHVDKNISQFISDEPQIEKSETNVSLNISNKYFSLIDLKTEQIIERHDLSKISFVSIGDSENSNFIVYLAKNKDDWRACYVLESSSEQTGPLLNKINKVFGLIPKLDDTTSLNNPSSFELSVSGETTSDNGNIGLLSRKWFHGIKDKTEAELLLQNDGDFLVRGLQEISGQFVLTGMQSMKPIHLLLIDDKGYVRTKDRLFENIDQLILYYWKNSIPILNENCDLVLRNPILY